MQGAKSTVIPAGDVTIDLANHLVTRNGAEVKLSATEFKLLAYLASNVGRVLTYRAILTNVWGYSEANQMEYLRVYILQLRRKLEEDSAQATPDHHRDRRRLSICGLKSDLLLSPLKPSPTGGLLILH